MRLSRKKHFIRELCGITFSLYLFLDPTEPGNRTSPLFPVWGWGYTQRRAGLGELQGMESDFLD
jgi:hypothetical protein